jgi:hypothetical protein
MDHLKIKLYKIFSQRKTLKSWKEFRSSILSIRPFESGFISTTGLTLFFHSLIQIFRFNFKIKNLNS